MQKRIWKICVALFTVLSVVLFIFASNFHGYFLDLGSTGSTPSGTSEGSVIVVYSLPNYDVRSNLILYYTGPAGASGTVVLQNSTTYFMNSSSPSLDLILTIHGNRYSGTVSGISPNGSELTQSNPVGSYVVNGVTLSQFKSGTIYSQNMALLIYAAVFVSSPATFQIKAVAMPL